MNDITALMASMKAAAEKATPGEWCCDGRHGVIADAGLNANFYIASCSGPEHRSNTTFIATANPANVLALVEALEARDKQISEMSTICAETYQVVGALADAARVFESSEGVSKALDNLSLERLMHTDVIPFSVEPRTVTVKLPSDAEHDVMAPVAAYFSEKFGWDGGAIRWDGRKEYDVLSDRVKYALKMVCRRAGIQVIEGEGQHGGNCE